MERREARGGTLILGGGFAGSYVARLLERKGATACWGRSRPSAFPGWFVARTYHLYQLPLFTRKVRVVADWTVALFFRRDIVELSMLGQQRHLGD